MRDVSETRLASSDAVDRLLEDAGARWRGEQPEPRRIDASLFSADRASRFAGGWPGHAWSFLAGAAATVAILSVLAVAAPNLLPRVGGGAPVTPDPATGYLPTGLENCTLTKARFDYGPPDAFDDPEFPEPAPGNYWYGSLKLYTQIDDDGEVWAGLPHSALGYTQKTFWWREGYRPSQEPNPVVYVTGRRLDGPGTFGFGPGTNASAGGDFGSAMLVGIDIPSTGCWELTATYYGETLSYVVWVGP
jgi:hypothetical protein